MNITESARAFVIACDEGKGWAECAQYCHEGATFSCQADALAEINSLEAYCDWAMGLLGPIPDCNCELVTLSGDGAIVTAVSIFKGTQTGPGPVDPPTGKTVASDYVYVMTFDGDRIKHMNKIWNDRYALRELGWA